MCVQILKYFSKVSCISVSSSILPLIEPHRQSRELGNVWWALSELHLNLSLKYTFQCSWRQLVFKTIIMCFWCLCNETSHFIKNKICFYSGMRCPLFFSWLFVGPKTFWEDFIVRNRQSKKERNRQNWDTEAQTVTDRLILIMYLALLTLPRSLLIT